MTNEKVGESVQKTFKLHTPYITLGQFLKAVNVIETGGQAKWYLKDHEVKINQQVDQRRGKKLRDGDLVEVPDHGQFSIVKSN